MKKWIVLIVLVLATIGASQLISGLSQPPEKTHLDHNMRPIKETPVPTEASFELGRVVQLQTSKGRIDFVLYEKDCPKITSQVANLAADGCYNNVCFVDANGKLIQTDSCTKPVPNLPLEVHKGLTQDVGAVCMSGTSEFYILTKPEPALNYKTPVFGHVIKGMDVVKKIIKNDTIKSAKVRPLTSADEELYNKVYQEK